MGEKWESFKAWFGKLGKALLPEIAIAYLRARAMDKFEIIMRGFGGVLTVWTISLFGGLITLVTSGQPQWGYVFAAGLGATGDYLVSVYRILFGASKTNGDETDTTIVT